MGAPNMMAYERDLLRALSRTASDGRRAAGRCVGLPAALDCLAALPFWTTLLDELGFSVVISHPAPEDYRWADRWFAPPSAEVCEPAKEVHGHVANLVRQGVDVVIFPTFERSNHCAVSSGYGSVIADGWADLARRADEVLPSLVVPHFTMAKPGALARDELIMPKLARLAADVRRLLAAREGVAGELPPVEVVRWADAAGRPLAAPAGAPVAAVPGGMPDEETLDRALQRALDQQRQFHRILEQETSEVLAWIHRDPSRRGLVMAGRPYHISKSDGASLDEEANRAGFAVLSFAGLADRGRQAEKLRRSTEPVHGFWQAKRLARAAVVAASDPQLDLACLVSFGCGYDAVAIEEVRAVMDHAHKPFLVLPMNGSAVSGAPGVRLRTLAAASRAREVGGGDAEPRPARKDWALATPDDICSVAKSMTAAMHRVHSEARGDDERIRGVEGAPSRDELIDFSEETGFLLPDLCEFCLTEGAPFLCGVPDEVPVEWEDMSDRFAAAVERQIEDARSTLGMAEEGAASGSAPRDAVGVMGNPWLLAHEQENHGIFLDILKAGLTPVVPDFALLRGEDVGFPAQLRRFCDQGVEHVIYLMPQGCMKGHVHVRGALHTLKEHFPSLQLTVIDYGPDGSSLNRRNRVALALAQVRAEQNR